MAISTYGWTPPKIKMVQNLGTWNLSDNASSFRYKTTQQLENSTNKINSMVSRAFLVQGEIF